MKICFVGPANSSHIVKWSRWFSSHGHEVHVVSFQEGEVPGAEVHLVRSKASAVGSDLNKLLYLLGAGKVKKAVKSIAPDVINVHYATSYGTVMALTGLKDYTLSVWGSDIYDFPNKSPLHRRLLSFSLRKAKYLFSTSEAMAKEAGKYTDKPFAITPFGVDMELFSPSKRNRDEDGRFVIGIVKLIEDLYGIDYMLKAAAILHSEHPEIPLGVRICGYGTKEEEYQQLAKQLGIGDLTVFTGRIPQTEAAVEWANMDVAVIPSVHHESFGVAAVEAQACETPVIVSDVGGLTEVTEPGKTSIVVPTKNEQAIVDALVRLFRDPALREEMGIAGRQRVLEKYELDTCFTKIESLYFKQINEGNC